MTDEHVFPQWLQSEFNLRDQFIRLRNGTKFKYRNITVPCCNKCNNEHLSQIENLISKAIRNDDADALKLNHDKTFIWLYKLMYGLHYKEMFLKLNIKDPLSESIVLKKEFFEKHSYNLFPLYAVDSIIFDGFSPYSIFVFRLSETVNGGYFYADEPDIMFSSIVVGNIGIVCSFQCDGYIEKAIKEKLAINQFDKLSLPQFGDFCSFVLHLKTRMKRLPNYICHSDKGRIAFKIQDADVAQLFNEFDPKRQVEITTKIYSSLFESIITNDSEGHPTINYKSPFVYF